MLRLKWNAHNHHIPSPKWGSCGSIELKAVRNGVKIIQMKRGRHCHRMCTSEVKVLKEQRGKEKKWSDVISSFGNDLRIMQMDSIDNNHFRQSVCGIWHFWGTRNSLNHCWTKVLSKHLVKRMFYQVPPSNRFNFVFFETRPSISSRSPIDW